MSGNSDKSDSWGSLLIDGIMTKMIQESGLRVVKSSDRNGDQKQGQKKAQQLPKKVFAEKDKDDFQQKKPTWKPCKSQYKGSDKFKNIDPEKKNDAFLNKRIANHEAIKKLNESNSPAIASKPKDEHNPKDSIEIKHLDKVMQSVENFKHSKSDSKKIEKDNQIIKNDLQSHSPKKNKHEVDKGKNSDPVQIK